MPLAKILANPNLTLCPKFSEQEDLRFCLCPKCQRPQCRNCDMCQQFGQGNPFVDPVETCLHYVEPPNTTDRSRNEENKSYRDYVGRTQG